MKGEEVAKLLRERKYEGVIEEPSAMGTEEHPLCNDKVSFYITVEEEHIKEIKYEAYQCASTIAGSELTASMAKGKTLEDAETISLKDLEDKVGKIGNTNRCCKEVAIWALKKAISSYKSKAEI
ncbi:NifU-like protein [archaeon]|nr:NifU-like protein [archaeon]